MRLLIFSLEYPEHRECPLPTPLKELSLSFVSSSSFRTDTDTFYGASGTPRMPRTYTTTRIILEFCVLNHRSDRYRHSLWSIRNAENAPYLHHSKNSPRVLCPQQRSPYVLPKQFLGIPCSDTPWTIRTTDLKKKHEVYKVFVPNLTICVNWERKHYKPQNFSEKIRIVMKSY